MDKDNSLSAITSLLSLVTPRTSTSTTTPNISKEGVNAIVQQILESNQGLAAVASGQKAAGGYKSSVNTQLINDLIARTAAATAKESSGTTTVTKQKAPVGSDLLSLLTLYSAGQKLFKGNGVTSATAGTGTSFGDAIPSSLGAAGADTGAVWDSLMGNSSIPLKEIFAANNSADPIGDLVTSQGWSGGAESAPAATTSNSSAETATAASTGAAAGEWGDTVLVNSDLPAGEYFSAAGTSAGTSAAVESGAETAGTSALGTAASTAGYIYAAKNAYDKYNKYKEEGDTGGQVGSVAGTAIGSYFGGPVGANIGAQFGGTVGSAIGDVLASFDDSVLQPVEHGIGNILSGIGNIFGW